MLNSIRRQIRLNITPDIYKSLNQQQPYRVIFFTSLVWGQLFLAFWVALNFEPLYSILSFFIICACMQTMLLWTHEASHNNLFRSAKLNDLWCSIFFSAPLGVDIKTYRRHHSSHHRAMSTKHDLDKYAYDLEIEGPKPFLSFLMKTLSGFEGLRLIKNKYLHKEASSSSKTSKLITIAFNLTLAAFLTIFGKWYLYFILWVYPLLSVTIFLNNVRSIGEHLPKGDRYLDETKQDLIQLVRTTTPNFFEKWFMYQANFNYHLEHHLFPSIPAHNLPKLHAILKEIGIYNRHPECIQKSGTSTFLKFGVSSKV